jgi:hypothetical protein
MMMRMLQRLLKLMGVIGAMAFPLLALAEDEKKIDARTINYPGANSEPFSTALTWLLMVVVAVVALAGLFKSAKRTHLD